MIRATTPKHFFIFQIDPTGFRRILVTYTQGDKIILEKEKDDLRFEQVVNPCTQETEWKGWYQLTQQETKLFEANSGKPVRVQVRVLTSDGDALASEKKTVSVVDVLNDEVLI